MQPNIAVVKFCSDAKTIQNLNFKEMKGTMKRIISVLLAAKILDYRVKKKTNYTS